MALNIPNVGTPMQGLMSGINTGSTLMSRIMQPIIAREQMAQRQKLAEQQLAQQMKIHQDAFGLQRQNAARAAQFDPMRAQILQQKLLGLKNKNDPMYAMNQYKALQDMILGSGKPQQAAPTQEMGEGMGMFSQEGMQDAQAPMQDSSSGAGIDIEAMRAHPELRAAFKNSFGYDPLAQMPQTPEEKQNAALNLFQKKEDIKKQNRGGSVPTNTVLTQNQQALQGIRTVLPMLDEIINNPSKVYGRSDFDRSKRAAYNAKTSGMIDTLIAAQQLPKVQASIDLVEQQIRRGTGEGVSAYIERLKDLRKDLRARSKRAEEVVKNRNINTEGNEDFSSMSDEELRAIAGGG